MPYNIRVSATFPSNSLDNILCPTGKHQRAIVCYSIIAGQTTHKIQIFGQHDIPFGTHHDNII